MAEKEKALIILAFAVLWSAYDYFIRNKRQTMSPRTPLERKNETYPTDNFMLFTLSFFVWAAWEILFNCLGYMFSRIEIVFK